MLWSAILPLQIAFCLLAVLVFGLTRWSPKGSRFSAFSIYLVMVGFCLIPSCMVVDKIIAPYRFRISHYDTYDATGAPHSAPYLPPAAKDIHIHWGRNGYRAKFTISQQDLDAWFEKAVARMVELGEDTYGSSDRIVDASSYDLETYAKDFAAIGWNKPETATMYNGPYESDWGGSTILYDADTSTAYQRTAVW